MARYIDADALKRLRNDVLSGKLNIGNEGDLIDVCPTADVVPRSEVPSPWDGDCIPYDAAERLKEKAIDKVIREIFAEIEFEIHQLDFDRDETRAIAIEGIIANAKKKYTEEKQ